MVLNDIEIFSTPEIYSAFLINFHHMLPEEAIIRMLSSCYKISIDKNHRIGNGRYNAMFSKDFSLTFANVFCLYFQNLTYLDNQMQSRYFNLLMKLIYQNILLVGDEGLTNNTFSNGFDDVKNEDPFFQINQNKTKSKDLGINKNMEKILQNNPSLFHDIHLCFVKLCQEKDIIGEEFYRERIIQVLFIFVYMLIACKDQKEGDIADIIIQSKDYLFKSPETVKYGILLFMFLFSDKYNKNCDYFKKAFITSSTGVESLIVKLEQSENEEQFIRNFFLICLLCLDSTKELKSKVIQKIDLLRLSDNFKIYNFDLHNQKCLISYIIEM